jgi:hypothetical protein
MRAELPRAAVCRGVGTAFAIAILLGACARSAPPPGPAVIVLQDPVSGRIVPCGPPPGSPSAHPEVEAEACAALYQRQGYRRLPIERPPQ